MASYIFDIEANGFMPKVNTVFCIILADIQTAEVFEYGPDAIQAGLEHLGRAELLAGHNVLGYDLPVLYRIHGFIPSCPVIDTLVCGRLIHGNIKNTDFDEKKLPGKLMGSHSLEAWGIRLGEHKASYTGGFDAWSQEMQDYCRQDVLTNLALFRYLDPLNYAKQAIALEHEAFKITEAIETEGWPFDASAAQTLYTKLVKRRDELQSELVAKYGSWSAIDKVFTPKRDNKKLGYLKGVEVTRYKTVVFNPGSRQHIEKKLREGGWVPKEFTESGAAKLDEEILLSIDLPEAKLLIEFLLVQKRLGQIGDGDNAWLRVVADDGRIHARYNSCGTNTGRAAHYTPNISQVPSVGAPYGGECRGLFVVPKGWKLVGADMSGLELRCLASYIGHFDGGAYAKLVTEGDVHTFHQGLLGLAPGKAGRDISKVFIYAFLYGAGPKKIASILGVHPGKGKMVIDQFMQRFPALKALRKAVVAAAKRGFIKGLDGRLLTVRSEHSALNTLLQSAGAILCKTWLVDFKKSMEARGYAHGWNGDFSIAGFIHDECQVGCKAAIAEEVGALLVECAERAGEPYGFKCPLTGEFKIGNNWAETH